MLQYLVTLIFIGGFIFLLIRAAAHFLGVPS